MTKSLLFIENLKAADAAMVEVRSPRLKERRRGLSWSLTVVFEGKKLGHVYNTGTGGATIFDFSPEVQEHVKSALLSNGYELKPYEDGEVVGEENWLEEAFCQICDELADRSNFQFKAQTALIFELTVEPFVASYRATDTPNLREQIQAHYGADFVRFVHEEILAL